MAHEAVLYELYQVNPSALLVLLEPYIMLIVCSSVIRFQVVVLSFYKQILAQNTSVLADVNEDNFDRAFGFLRPSQPALFLSWS